MLVSNKTWLPSSWDTGYVDVFVQYIDTRECTQEIRVRAKLPHLFWQTNLKNDVNGQSEMCTRKY